LLIVGALGCGGASVDLSGIGDDDASTDDASSLDAVGGSDGATGDSPGTVPTGSDATLGDDTGALDTGVADTGVIDSGLADTGVADTGVADTGVADTGVADTGVADTGVADTGVADTGVADTGVADTGVADTGVADTGVADTGVADTGVADTGVGDTGVVDTGVVDTGATDSGGCGVLGANPADVYVDGTVTATGNGTAACPFKTILEATSLAAPTGGVARTIHVAGGSSGAPLVYREKAQIVIPASVTLLGTDGFAATEIDVTTDGTCTGFTERCSVYVNGGALDGFTVHAAANDGVAIGGGTTKVAVSRTRVTAAKGAGFYVVGSASFVGVRADHNAGNGLTAQVAGFLGGTGAVTIGSDAALGIDSSFDHNGGAGLSIGASVALDATNVTASFNTGDGLHLVAAAFSIGGTTTTSTVTGGAFSDNGDTSHVVAGVFVEQGVGLKVRGAEAKRNTGVGVVVRVANTTRALVDLGTAADHGCNAFGNGADVNTLAGVCVEFTGAQADGVVDAAGDDWNATMCPIVEHSFTSGGIGAAPSCFSSTGGYFDVTFTGGGGFGSMPATNPVQTGGVCTGAGC
jgi:hypothetical protein